MDDLVGRVIEHGKDLEYQGGKNYQPKSITELDLDEYTYKTIISTLEYTGYYQAVEWLQAELSPRVDYENSDDTRDINP